MKGVRNEAHEEIWRRNVPSSYLVEECRLSIGKSSKQSGIEERERKKRKAIRISLL